MPQAALNSIGLYYEFHGRGDAAGFAHGRGGNHLSWWRQIPDLTRDFQFVTFDHHGFGHSRDLPDGAAQDSFADDLVALLDHLSIERDHLVAQTMGGRTCLAAAQRHPGVWRLVLAATAAGIVDAELASVASVPGQAPQDLMRRVLSDGFRQREPALSFPYAQIEALNHVDGSPARLRTKGPTWDDVGGLVISTQIVVGDDDPLVPVQAALRLATILPRAELRIIPGAGHSAYFEKPEEFNRLVRAFLTAAEDEAVL